MSEKNKSGPDAPQAPPERPAARCRGCPYPAHGFICWSRDGDCMRQRIARINHISLDKLLDQEPSPSPEQGGMQMAGF